MAIKDNVKDISVWQRGFFILLFGVVLFVTFYLICFLVVFQFIIKVCTGKLNEQILSLGDNLSKYVYQILCYISFGEEQKPYPFSPWSSSTEITKPKTPKKD